MADYTIYVIDESDLTLSDGKELDGVTQGDGSHLVPGVTTITITTASYQPVEISDTDNEFEDNGNQTLNGAQTIDGTLYADGTRVEAEYGLVLTDGTTTYTAVAFNVREGSPPYATIEGLAFVGPAGSFPPEGAVLTVVSTSEGPGYESEEYVTPICYAADTLIDTPNGPRKIQSLTVGDLVWTADRGPQPIAWTDQRQVFARGAHAPIAIPSGHLGATRDLLVSPAHRLVITDPMADLLFDTAQVFVAATHLEQAGQAHRRPTRHLRYCHIALDHHAVIRANGVLSESLRIGDASETNGLTQNHFFPSLAQCALPVQRPARRCLRRHEARLLLAHQQVIENTSDLRQIA